MYQYSCRGHQGRRSGTGCGCGCSGGVSNPLAFQPTHSPVYQPAYEPAYKAVYEPANQLMNQMGFQPMNQKTTTNQLLTMTETVDLSTPSPELLTLLEEAVAGEREDQIFYEQLIALAPTTVEKDIITGIRDDEMSHNKQFRHIYRELTDKDIQTESERISDEQPLSYIANLRKALFGEIAAVKKYRIIRSELTSKQHRDTLFNIITDELTHMGQYNYLITINKHP